MEYDIIVPTIGNDRVKQIFRVSKGDKNMLPISDILIRSISGYVFIVPVFILYFLYLKKSGRKQSLLHITAVFLFYYYLFGILTVTGIGYTSTISFRPRISLIPFLGMISGRKPSWTTCTSSRPQPRRKWAIRSPMRMICG